MRDVLVATGTLAAKHSQIDAGLRAVLTERRDYIEHLPSLKTRGVVSAAAPLHRADVCRTSARDSESIAQPGKEL